MSKQLQFWLFLFFLPALIKAEVKDVIVFFDGSTAIALIDSIEFDSLKYIDRDTGDTLRIAKKKLILFIMTLDECSTIVPQAIYVWIFLKNMGVIYKL